VLRGNAAAVGVAMIGRTSQLQTIANALVGVNSSGTGNAPNSAAYLPSPALRLWPILV
jgi:hypothetical protein